MPINYTGSPKLPLKLVWSEPTPPTGTVYHTDQTLELPVIDTRTVADILYGAADLIEKNGWVQGSLWSNNGFCALGAIQITTAGRLPSRLYLETVTYLVKHMRANGYLNLPGLPGAIEAWNDAPERSKFEVLELLRQAAKEWKNEHKNVA